MKRITIMLIICGGMWLSPITAFGQPEEGTGEVVETVEVVTPDEGLNEPTEAVTIDVEEVTVVEDIPDSEAVPETIEEAVETVGGILGAAKHGNWGLVIAGIIMVLVFVMRKYALKRIDAKYVPWITAGLVNLVLVAEALIQGTPIGQAFLVGFLLSTAAGGLWSLVGKHLAGEEY